MCQRLQLNEAQRVIKVVILGRWAHYNVKLHFFFIIVILIALAYHFENTLADLPMESCKFW